MFFDDWEQLSKPTIRPAIPSDVRAVARIHVDGWLETYRGVVPDEMLDSLSYADRERTWMRLIAGGDTGPFVYVADHPRDGVTGFIAGTTEGTDDPAYDGEVYVVYVTSAHQKSGVGRSLMRYVTQVMIDAGCRGMLLWTFSGSPTNEFFRRLGGLEAGSRTRSYGGFSIDETAFGWTNLQRLLVETDETAEPTTDLATDAEHVTASDPGDEQADESQVESGAGDESDQPPPADDDTPERNE